jgi:hypothetical protein
LDLKSDKRYNILGYYSKVPIITELFKPNQNPLSGGNFSVPFAGKMNSCIMCTICMQSSTQSRGISSEVYSRRNLNYSIFITVSFTVLWQLILSSCNQTSSFEISQPRYFSQSRRKICWQQQKHKRELTTRVSRLALFQYLAFACSRQVGFTKPTVDMTHNTTVEADNKDPTASSMKYRAALLPCQRHCSFKDRIASWLYPSAFSGSALLIGCPTN